MSYRTQTEADTCGLRSLAEPQYKEGTVVAYTFFEVKKPWSDQPSERNHWRVIVPSAIVIPSLIDDHAHEHKVRVEQIVTEAVRDFPESELR